MLEIHYLTSIAIMMLGMAIIISSENLLKKLMGLAIFQNSALVFYISTGYVSDSSIPILKEGIQLFTNPLPHVLMLTAIVVGVATFALGLALIIRIKEETNTIEEREILDKS